jgi:hypothetical protein
MKWIVEAEDYEEFQKIVDKLDEVGAKYKAYTHYTTDIESNTYTMLRKHGKLRMIELKQLIVNLGYKYNDITEVMDNMYLKGMLIFSEEINPDTGRKIIYVSRPNNPSE